MDAACSRCPTAIVGVIVREKLTDLVCSTDTWGVLSAAAVASCYWYSYLLSAASGSRCRAESTAELRANWTICKTVHGHIVAFKGLRRIGLQNRGQGTEVPYYHYHTLHYITIFTAQCTLVQSAVLRSHVVRPSVTLVDCDHTSWKSWKLIAQPISPTPSLFVTKRRSTYSHRNMWKFVGD